MRGSGKCCCMNPITSQVVLLSVICKPADWARGARHWFPEHQIPQPVCQKVAPANKKVDRKKCLLMEKNVKKEKEMSPDGKRARLAETEMAARL